METRLLCENDIAKMIVDSAYRVHSEIGAGLLESVYEVILAQELRERGLKVNRQVPISIQYRNFTFDEGFRADLVVDERVLVELKSVDGLQNAHRKQVLTYLRLSGLRLGLLINFSQGRFRDGIVRIVNRLPE